MMGSSETKNIDRYLQVPTYEAIPDPTPGPVVVSGVITADTLPPKAHHQVPKCTGKAKKHEKKKGCLCLCCPSLELETEEEKEKAFMFLESRKNECSMMMCCANFKVYRAMSSISTHVKQN